MFEIKFNEQPWTFNTWLGLAHLQSYIYGMREREREREETYWYDIGIIDVVKMKNEYNVLKKNH